MITQLKFKDKKIPGYFIDDKGQIFDKNGLRQETYINNGYQTFKRIHVHKMMVHSFYGYKPGFDVHHRNEIKTDNHLQNLLYLTRKDHARLHMLGKTYSHSEETKQKIRDSKDKKKVLCLESGIVYESIRAASRELSINVSNLSKHLNKKCYKSVGGLHFEFVGDNNEAI